MNWKSLIMIFAAILILPSTSFGENKGIMGALLGAGVGAAIGHSADRTGGAGKGAVIGAIGGYVIGQQMENKQLPAKAEAPKEVTHDCQIALDDTDRAANIYSKEKKVFLLQNANRICPSSARIHNDLGVAYYQRSRQYDEERAKMELQEALRIDPNYTVAKRNLKAM